MKQIKNIVYLMLENRSLDQALGWLYKYNNPKNVIPKGSSSFFNGLQTGNYWNPDNSGNPVIATMVSDRNMQVPSVDPNEPYENVNNQLFRRVNNPTPGEIPGMKGFYKDFSSTSSGNFAEIMQCYDPSTLIILNALAGNYAVSDAYFSSVPTQTNCNRAFAATGNSIGTLWGASTAMVDNHWDGNWIDPSTPVDFNGRTIWDVLSENGYSSKNDWMIYYSQYWTDLEQYCFTQDLLWPSLKKYNNFSDISNFFTQAAAGTLPSFSFLEPAWYEILYNGNDYHPPANLAAGEAFLCKIFGALRQSPQWNETLLIINFDEHGGTYDHVPPPWGAKAPWSDPSDGTAKPQKYEHDFLFDRFGVRVPLILVSPNIPASTVFRSETAVPYDHTSVIATILNNFGIDKSRWKLGSRVANAPTFENVVSLNTPREDSPELEEPVVPVMSDHVAPNDLQLMVSGRMLLRASQRAQFPREQLMALYEEELKNVKTVAGLMSVTYKLLKMMEGK